MRRTIDSTVKIDFDKLYSGDLLVEGVTDEQFEIVGYSEGYPSDVDAGATVTRRRKAFGFGPSDSGGKDWGHRGNLFQ